MTVGMKGCSWSCLILAVALTSSPARAEQAAKAELLPQHRIVYSNLVAARLNPLGLEDRLDLGYRYRLYSKPGLLWRDAYVGVAFTPTFNPAVERIGAEVQFKPLAVLYLSAGYYFVGWLGTFQYLQSYDSAHAEHSDSALDDGRDADNNYSAIGSELQLRAQVLAKVGPIVVRNDLNLFRASIDLEGDDRLFYNPRIDAMVPNNGWALTNDTDVVYLSKFGLVAGVRTSIVHAFYRDSDYQAGESTDNPNTPLVRVGPLLAYVFYNRPDARYFNKPTVLAIVQWNVKHRYRTGEDVSQGIPTLVLGFKFEGSLWER